jgi:hypothetical protein
MNGALVSGLGDGGDGLAPEFFVDVGFSDSVSLLEILSLVV